MKIFKRFLIETYDNFNSVVLYNNNNKNKNNNNNDNNNNNNGNFLFPTNTTLHDDTHHSQLGMTGKFTSPN